MKALPLRQAALSRHTAPSFVLMAGLELMQVRRLPWLARCLFCELLAMADHATGRISTSYAVLISLLDFDQVPGTHAADKPSMQRVRTALEQLIALGLVRVDRIKNEKAKGLFLQVRTRAGISAPDPGINRRSNRPKKAENQATARHTAVQTPKEQQTEQQGVQERDLSPISPSLSTAHKPSRTVLAMKAKLRPRAGGTP